MKREDIAYFNSWEKCFKPASPAIVMQALLNGIWISSNKDPEDIYKVYPKLIVDHSSPSVNQEFGLCPFEFSFEDMETYEWAKESGKPSYKGRLIKQFGESWHLDCYEMRKCVTKNGLEWAEHYKITKEEVEALHEKHGWDDQAMYDELMANRPDLWSKSSTSDNKYANLHILDFMEIRAAFCPHMDPMYNWMDYPSKAGFDYPDWNNR